MASTLELIVGGDTLDISDDVNYRHLSHDGFGMTPLHRITERGPLQHGETDRGFRLDPRLVNIVLLLRADDWAAGHFDRREELLSYLSPIRMTKLRFTNDDGDVRQLDCYCVSGPTFSSKDIIGKNIRAGFTLKANETWYDPGGEGVTFDMGGGSGSGILIPMEVPFEVGSSDLDENRNIVYTGSWHSFPIITINGPIDDPIITNLTTGEVLDFTGVSLAAAEWYKIDLRYGYKTVVDDAGANQIATLTTDSDLVSWHLEANTTNTINVTGSSADESTSIEVVYFTRYLGV